MFGRPWFNVGMFYNCNVVSFCGNRVGAEAASYGFDCPLNHIFWMAGPRARPQDGRTRWNQGPTTSQFGKHRGKRFSEVRAEDPDYLAWAKGQEAKLRKLFTARSDSIEHVLEYAASKDDTAKYDFAYKESLTTRGMG